MKDEQKRKINNLDGFLKKFHAIIPRDALVKETLIQVVQEMFTVTLTKNQIKVQGKNIFLSLSPLVKQEILFKKEEVLQYLAGRIGSHIVKDIL
jgi:hypothetical protein